MLTGEPEQPPGEFTVHQQTAPLPRIPDTHRAARDGHGQAPRRGGRRRALTLLSYEPNPDELFLRPGDAVRPPRAPARFRGGNGKLFLGALAAVIAVAVFFTASALAGSHGHGTPAPGHGTLSLAPQPASASGAPSASASGAPSARASGAPSVTMSGSQPAPAPQLNQMGAATATVPGTQQATQQATAQKSQVPAVTSLAPTVAASPTAASGQAAVTVGYAVDQQAGDELEAEVDVTNEGTAPISGWQIVLVLPDDQVTALVNATGYVSHHILLLQPASSGSAIAAGATLRVYFFAQGTQTAPEVCAFDDVPCG